MWDMSVTLRGDQGNLHHILESRWRQRIGGWEQTALYFFFFLADGGGAHNFSDFCGSILNYLWDVTSNTCSSQMKHHHLQNSIFFLQAQGPLHFFSPVHTFLKLQLHHQNRKGFKWVKFLMHWIILHNLLWNSSFLKFWDSKSEQFFFYF